MSLRSIKVAKFTIPSSSTIEEVNIVNNADSLIRFNDNVFILLQGKEMFGFYSHACFVFFTHIFFQLHQIFSFLVSWGQEFFHRLFSSCCSFHCLIQIGWLCKDTKNKWRVKNEKWRISQNMLKNTKSSTIYLFDENICSTLRRICIKGLKGWDGQLCYDTTHLKESRLQAFKNIYNRARKLIILFLKQIRKYSHSCMDEHW